MRAKAHHQNKFMRFITIPIRVLNKAMDMYVKRMTDCADKVGYGNIMGGPVQPVAMPRSFSSSSTRSNDSEDFRELMRIASTRSLGNTVNMDLHTQQHKSQPNIIESRGVPRSCSVGMGRIDEDKPCVFGEDNVNFKTELKYPRSRSYAVTKRSVVF
ncbi:unnamed protein product [Ilex paraguariensis]|uniref:Uncharacterized protein n=1 Tax=Ilex paraguariensis TaxID=185542 RepID=A0ABC8TN53_9AQUA